MHSQKHRHRLHLRFSFLLVAAATTTLAAAGVGTALATAAPSVPPAAASHVSNSTCSRSKHVVLASFGEPEEYHTVSLYFASKFPNASVHHLWLHLGNKEAVAEMAETTTMTATTTSSSSALRWQLLGKHAASLMNNRKPHRRKSPVDWRAFYSSHGIHRSVIDMASLDAYHELRRTYLHSSVNGYEYELLCFARFIGLHEFCSSKGIDQLTWIDADIPIFDPDFLGRVCLPRGYSVWALTSGSSFLNTMTCSEIGRFVDFMLDFYAKENRHALVRAIHAHGSNNMDNAQHISEKVRRAEPAFAELGIDPKHFSDMFLFSKFLQDTNAIAAKAALEEQEKVEEEAEEKKKEEEVGKKGEAVAPSNSTVRIPHFSKTYIHQDENGGTIDPYFLPIISIRNVAPHPDSDRLCVNETVWNQYYSVHTSVPGADASAPERGAARTREAANRQEAATREEASRKRPTVREKTRARIGLSSNEGGTWVPIPGAHFQGDDCKDRLLRMFARGIAEDARAR